VFFFEALLLRPPGYLGMVFKIQDIRFPAPGMFFEKEILGTLS
jgi:hypothetical protein